MCVLWAQLATAVWALMEDAIRTEAQGGRAARCWLVDHFLMLADQPPRLGNPCSAWRLDAPLALGEENVDHLEVDLVRSGEPHAPLPEAEASELRSLRV